MRFPFLINQQGFADAAPTHFVSSTVSGLVATVVTCPVDVVKSRVMNMQRGTGAQYSSPMDCVIQTCRVEGLRGLYKGFGATFVRQTPHTILLWMFQEQWLKLLQNKWDISP